MHTTQTNCGEKKSNFPVPATKLRLKFTKYGDFSILSLGMMVASNRRYVWRFTTCCAVMRNDGKEYWILFYGWKESKTENSKSPSDMNVWYACMTFSAGVCVCCVFAGRTRRKYTLILLKSCWNSKSFFFRFICSMHNRVIHADCWTYTVSKSMFLPMCSVQCGGVHCAVCKG